MTDGAEEDPFVYADYDYDQVGNRTRVDLGNTTYTTYAYDGDPRYRVKTIEHYKKGSPDTLLAGMAYYDPQNPGDMSKYRDGAGNPRYMCCYDSASQSNVTYVYDNNSRLTSAETSFTYDWVGNRNPSTHTYNAADHLVVSPDHQYEYDSAGNLTFVKDSSGQTVQKQYSYTAANLLEKVIHGPNQNDPASLMEWDADGNRVSFSSSTGGTWEFVYDVTAGIPAVVEEVYGAASTYYVRAPNGSVIARISGSDTKYYHFDALGSTRLLTDDDGAVTDTYSYDAWGNATHDSGSIQQPYQYVGQLGYYRHCQDGNLPLLQLGLRLYAPGLARFTQEDPLLDYFRARASSEGAYVYASANPVRRTDARGLYSTVDCDKNCPKLAEYVRQALHALEDEDCWNAVNEVGCADYMDRMRDPGRNPLQGVEIVCVPCSAGSRGAAGNGWFALNCKGSGSGAPGVILHELTHLCAYAAGEKPNPQGPWTCPYPGCDSEPWKNADPVWEGRAETVRHRCWK